MKKLNVTQSKKNAEKVRKRLEGTKVVINLLGEINGELSCADALLKGHLLLSESKRDEALIIANALLVEIDDVVDIYLLKARALLELEALYELSLLIEPLVAAAPNNHGVLMVASRYYYLLVQAEKSLMYSKKVASNDPRNVEALLQMELCYRYSGETEKASKILGRCLGLAETKWRTSEEHFKQYTSALFRLASYALLNEKQLAELEHLCSRVNDPLLNTSAAYALATQYSKRNDQRSEIKYLTVANSSESRMLGLDARLKDLRHSYEKKLAQQRSCFDSTKPNWFLEIQPSSHAPVFVLGLPRSGTTLLEQILSGHAEIGQVGESKAFTYALKQVFRTINPIWRLSDYPLYVDRLSADALNTMCSNYENHQSVLTPKKVYIDKELSNFEHVGLMGLVLPKAKFIHMDRAPMDIFLSCFRNSIPGVPETADLTAIAEDYLYMKRLIGYWRSLYPNRFMIINYQELVQEPEKISRQASKFVGVDFHPAMLDFHKRKNIVRTLSVDQVRKKVYTSSIEGWRKYSDVLEPARLVLEKNHVPVEGISYL